jgi:virulence factor Mce-like protein
MQKQAPTLGRMIVMVYQVDVSFAEGTQLAVEADVRISGVPVGKVKTVEASGETGRSTARIELEEDYAPLARDTKAILRQKTLLGETYVELTPGDPRTAGTIPEGGALAIAQVSPTVELDEIFRAFDLRTRRAFQSWMQDNAVATRGRARDINDALGNLEPLAEDANVLLRILNSQEGAVQRVVKNTGVVFDALSERQGQLQGAITNSNRVFETTAARDAELQDFFRVLPTFNRESKITVDRLTEFARDTDPLIDQLRPAAREFSPTFQQVEKLAPDLKALFRDLDPLITASRTGQPALRRFLADLRPFLGEFDPTLKQLNPILSMLGNYRDELRSFFANVPTATQASTPDGVHYLRTTNPQNPENYAVYPRRIGSNRTNPMMAPRGFDNITRGGMLSYETRHCRSGNPVTAPAEELATLLQNQLPILQQVPPSGPPNPLTPTPPSPNDLAANILNFAFSNAGRDVPNVPCREQPPFRINEGKYVTRGGQVTKYAQVKPAASSTRTP